MDIGSAAWKLDEYKSELWSTTNIGVPHLDIEANDAIILGYMVADFVAEVNLSHFKLYVIFIHLYSNIVVFFTALSLLFFELVNSANSDL